jgi:Type IV secretion system pilin
MSGWIKSLIASLILAPLILLISAPTFALYNPLEAGCQNADNVSCKQAEGQGTDDPIAGPNGVINKAATIIALVAGIGAVFMVIIGGFFYVTSSGNSESVAKARARIVAALVGLVIVALAGTIVMFVTGKVIR